ncbi:hypothetical protein [Allostreptomyces psammosilenae]|uniref:Uncharacterized protein n=1 Tax=Allostreptomyces psammosilenae TaxID=1892865 RepID=A0A853ACJ7_9ACTN|nr:hypothetical protein [Allostreptomyces psammosilenae]NYI08082.1 hypothetical protein [Allostreptomyces psammosilenae]
MLEIRDGRPVFGDILGLLESWDDQGITVRRADGEVVRVPHAALVAGKTVPPPPPRRRPRGPAGGRPAERAGEQADQRAEGPAGGPGEEGGAR